MLAQFALANGWNEDQTAFLIEAWRFRHDLPLHNVELDQMLSAGMKATAALRRAFSSEKEKKMKDKTSYRILEFLAENSPAIPAEVARELDLPRETVKKSLQRLAKAGEVQKMGRGKYSTGTQTGTNEVIELSKERKIKKKLFSITKDVPVLSPAPNGTLRLVDPQNELFIGGMELSAGTQTGTDEVIELSKERKTKKKLFSITKDVPVLSPAPEDLSIGEEQLTPEEQYLRQIRCVERPDGSFEVDPPDDDEDGPTLEQELKLQVEFERWKRELEAFKLTHPEALLPKENPPKAAIIMRSDPADWFAPAVRSDDGSTAEFWFEGPV